ncbi:GNAT family N-acetyltransferase [Celerinatantimonas sp. YJH-8]|uniref:GNAT family N-acetyltransferase n=1 Tax=Celerinatantimonas sp. YJH-8 TaxID=3228714 RepID=UPI0038BE4080
MEITLRPALESDIEFLMDLRRTTLHRYIDEIGMPNSQEAYRERVLYKFDCAQIVEVNGSPAGLFKVEYHADQHQWYVIQIQIAADYQNLKIGSQLIHSLQEKARLDGASVGLGVIKTNPAQRLYARLGFKQVGESKFEYELEFHPES